MLVFTGVRIFMLFKTSFVFLLFVASSLACKSNGACGCCGCRAKAKARAALTKGINADELTAEDDGNIFGLSIWNKTELKVDKETYPLLINPNHLFHRCCEERALPAACVKHCHFNEYSGDLLREIFLGNNECSIDFIPEMQFCAAQGSNHQQCCSASGVTETSAGEKCLVFCDQTPDKFTGVDYSYTPCLDKFEGMKRCFYTDIKRRAKEKFDPMLSQQTGAEGAGYSAENIENDL